MMAIDIDIGYALPGTVPNISMSAITRSAINPHLFLIMVNTMATMESRLKTIWEVYISDE